MNRKTHWETVYTTKALTDVSWYQAHPTLSLAYIENADVGKAGHIVDVGGGASTLVDHLLAEGYRHITVLDVASAALAATRARLGSQANQVTWINGDVTQENLPAATFDLWHDRAVFHFLTDATDRSRYIAQVRRVVKAGGHLIIATFATDGPTHCSGLAVARYDLPTLQSVLGGDFVLIESGTEQHITPFATTQSFLYTHWRKI